MSEEAACEVFGVRVGRAQQQHAQRVGGLRCCFLQLRTSAVQAATALAANRFGNGNGGPVDAGAIALGCSLFRSASDRDRCFAGWIERLRECEGNFVFSTTLNCLFQCISHALTMSGIWRVRTCLLDVLREGRPSLLAPRSQLLVASRIFTRSQNSTRKPHQTLHTEPTCSTEKASGVAGSKHLPRYKRLLPQTVYKPLPLFLWNLLPVWCGVETRVCRPVQR